MKYHVGVVVFETVATEHEVAMEADSLDDARAKLGRWVSERHKEPSDSPVPYLYSIRPIDRGVTAIVTEE